MLYTVNHGEHPSFCRFCLVNLIITQSWCSLFINLQKLYCRYPQVSDPTVRLWYLHSEDDSRTFKKLYDKIKDIGMETLAADAGYKTPAIAKLLIDDGIRPLLPYKRPLTKKGFFKKYEYAYDEYYDCYICPNNSVLEYSTTNRDGYREYKSCGKICETCPYLEQCTLSKNHVKVITRHVWEDYIEKCEDIRHTSGMKERYAQRKQTIERIFGTAKENHGFRYTQMIGKARMEMKAGLTFACMNLKKLAKMIQYREYKGRNCPMFSGRKSKYTLFGGTQKKLVLGWMV